MYRDLLRTIKLRFEAEGISIPFPQRDVHVIQTSPVAAGKVAPTAPPATSCP